MGLIASGVAWGSRKRLPPVASSSMTLVIVTSPIRHLLMRCLPRLIVRSHSKTALSRGDPLDPGTMRIGPRGWLFIHRQLECTARPGNGEFGGDVREYARSFVA